MTTATLQDHAPAADTLYRIISTHYSNNLQNFKTMPIEKPKPTIEEHLIASLYQASDSIAESELFAIALSKANPERFAEYNGLAIDMDKMKVQLRTVARKLKNKTSQP